jgi:hypothetical protein
MVQLVSAVTLHALQMNVIRLKVVLLYVMASYLPQLWPREEDSWAQCYKTF